MSIPGSIHIIGGGQGTGRWLVDRLLLTLMQAGRFKTFVYDTNAKALATLDSRVTACPVDTIRPDVFGDQFTPDDWVFLATPPPALPGVLDQFLPLIRPNTLLITMASVQTPPSQWLARHVPSNCSHCGLHLLCGPDVPSPVGQFAALTGIQPHNPQHTALKDLLTGVGLIVSTLDPAEHDRQMAYVQALTHFCLLGFAGTLDGDGVRPSDLFKVQTPNFQFLYAFASRMLKIAPTTTGSIQATPDATAVRAKLLTTLQTLHDQLSSADSVPAAANVIEQFREPFKAHEVDEGAAVAAVAVHQRQLFHDRLYAHRATGELLIFRHRGADKIRLVRVLDLRHDEVDVEEAVVTLPHVTGTPGQSTRLAVATNEIARRNYLSLGIRIPSPVCETIKKRNIQPLTDAEAAAFWRTGVVPMSLDVTLTNSNALSAEQCERGLPKLIDAIWRASEQSTYRGPDGVEKITLRIEFDPAWTREAIIERVKAVVERGQIWV